MSKVTHVIVELDNPTDSKWLRYGISDEYYGEGKPLIMCKDCKYSVDEYDDGDCYCDYNRNLSYIGKNWNHYCGYAERRTE